ncbi:repressor LexA [bacterium F11]|nr:repressor LexA [bacterium F11]
MKELTPKQKLIYDFIQEYVEVYQVPPSLREIGAHLDLSVGTVQDQVEAIRRKGFLQKDQTKARGLRLPIAAQQVPILGRVHAGPLHAALEDVEGHVAVGSKRTPSQHFALRVRGDSMVDAGILEGDLVIVRIQSVAEEGDIVVARVEDEATVKRFRRDGNRTLLEPANAAYEPISGVPFSIVGVVVELRRHYK